MRIVPNAPGPAHDAEPEAFGLDRVYVNTIDGPGECRALLDRTAIMVMIRSYRLAKRESWVMNRVVVSFARTICRRRLNALSP